MRALDVPEQSWNSGGALAHERENAAYLVDDRARDGFFYLVYAGTTELGSYLAQGHARLGLARSRDLVSWEAARER